MALIHKASGLKGYLDALNYVEPHERTCVSLVRRILDHADGVYTIKDGALVKGALFFKNDEMLFPCLYDCDDSCLKELAAFLKSKKLFCVSGEETSVEKIRQITLANKRPPLRERREYFLYSYSDTALGDAAVAALPDGVAIDRAEDGDMEQLAELQMDYITEEVALKGNPVNPNSEKRKMQEAVKKQIVIVARNGGEIVAKAQTNAIGLLNIQLGGVFTKTDWRKRGLAGALTAFLAQSVRQKQMGTVLFVGKNNTSAIHAYARAGFKDTGKGYLIDYYD